MRKERKDSSVSDVTNIRKAQGTEKRRKQLCALIANNSFILLNSFKIIQI